MINDLFSHKIRKAISQLYEYRYRYYQAGQIKKNTILILVLQNKFLTNLWMKDYLLLDRNIAVCWLKEEGNGFDCFDECRPILAPLIGI
jgi:hypothetical protein